jgi:DNA primase
MYAERLGEAMPHLVTLGISEVVARAHSVGFAPPEWRFLCDTFGEGSSEDLVASGLAVRTARGGTIDRYRNRIMFPVFRPDGRIAGFTGRTLESGSGVPKYLNSPEEAGFERNRVLLGVPRNTEEVRAAGFAYLVEGPFDLLAFAEAGIGNVLSPLSAHLSEEQAVILGNICRGGAVLAFDGDKAGREGARSSLAALFGLGIPGMIAQFPDGEDPCSVLSASGPEGVVSVIGAAGIPDRKKGVAGRVCEPAKTRKK